MQLYLNRNTLFNRLDPRTKIINFVSIFFSAMFLPDILSQITLFCIVLIIGKLAQMLKNIKHLKIVITMTCFLSILLWSASYPGTKDVLFFSIEGAEFGVIVAIKISTIIIAGIIFLSTTKVEEISLALIYFKVPYRVSFAFMTALRMVPTLISTSHIIIDAQKSRGLDLSTGTIIERFKKYIPLLVPVFLTSIRNTGTLAMALESKGFGYQKYRSYYLKLKMTSADFIILGLMLILCISVIYYRINFL